MKFKVLIFFIVLFSNIGTAKQLKKQNVESLINYYRNYIVSHNYEFGRDVSLEYCISKMKDIPKNNLYEKYRYFKKIKKIKNLDTFIKKYKTDKTNIDRGILDPYIIIVSNNNIIGWCYISRISFPRFFIAVWKKGSIVRLECWQKEKLNIDNSILNITFKNYEVYETIKNKEYMIKNITYLSGSINSRNKMIVKDYIYYNSYSYTYRLNNSLITSVIKIKDSKEFYLIKLQKNKYVLYERSQKKEFNSRSERLLFVVGDFVSLMASPLYNVYNPFVEKTPLGAKN